MSEADLDQAVDAAAQYRIGQTRQPWTAIEKLIRQTSPGDQLRRDLEDRFTRLLKSDAAPEAKLLACRQLWVIGTEASLPVLEEMLLDPATTDLACFALREYRTDQANAALRRALKTATGKPAMAIVNLLGSRRDPDAVAPLSEFARGADRPLALLAIDALGRIGTTQAARALERVREASNPEVQSAVTAAHLQCAQRLAQAGDTQAAVTLFKKVFDETAESRFKTAAFLGLTRLGGPELLRLVLFGIASDDPLLRTTAIGQVPIVPGSHATERFADTLSSASPDVQVLLLRALAERGDPTARTAVTALAESGPADVAAAALRALGRLGDASSVGVLVNAASASSDLAASALASLREIQADGITAALIKAMSSVSPELRVKLIGVLADRKANEAVPVLLEQAGATDDSVASAAFKALAQLAGPAQLDALMERLVNLSGDGARNEAEQAVVNVARKLDDAWRQADAVLAAYSTAREAAPRASLVRVLGELANAKAFGAVMAALQDREAPVREVALRTLANWPEPEAAQPLLHLARKAGDQTHKILLLRGYLRLLGLPSDRSAEQTLAAYAEGLELADRVDEKRLVLAGLAESGLPGAVTLIAPLLDQPGLQAEAALAVVQIAKANPGANDRQITEALRKVLSVANDGSVIKDARELLRQRE